MGLREWLEAHRLLWSPETARGYTSAQWWAFLQIRRSVFGGDRIYREGLPDEEEAVTAFAT
ncbi:hypothetical protein AB0F17_29520 [Nonomuraea sp. NPDC026600]|uniref:hypothetical protein n=1 Tax=Nonomuraea sp. NPDC026600 TaxID=3155363 RepID=UPI0033E109C9